MTIEPRKPSEVPEKVGGAALGIFFGLTLGRAFGGVVGGPAGAETAAAVGPLLTPVLEGWAARAGREFERRGQEIAVGVVSTSGLDETRTVDSLPSSDQLQPLVQRVLDAAARTNSTPKLRLLGAVLGQAISDRPRRIEADFLIVAALDDLESVHVRLLEALEQQPDSLNDAQRWISSNLAAACPDVSELAFYGALGGLVRHGLVNMLGVYGAVGYEMTDLGRAVLEVLRLDLGAGPPGRDARPSGVV